MMDFSPRPSQQAILRYTGGRLGIAAVPGAGKTHILSALAAQIIHNDGLQDGQEVLIVTLVNSAVDNFEARIKRFFAERPIQALYKYRVRTLHGLAHDIVREKPARVGLEERFSIIDEREAGFIRREAVNAWLASHAERLDDYLDPALDDSKRDWVRRQQLPELLDSLAMAFIRSSKDRLLTPESLRAKLDSSLAPLPLAELGWSIYADYQRALAYRGAVDFDDLIRLALTLLESDDEYLERLRFRYPFILEDEAQDSSLSQQRILGLLSGGVVSIRPDEHGATRPPDSNGGNWVRVGDPNQAIFETFTTADPELLRQFIAENPSQDMPESGRSQQSIISLANHLIDWVMSSHPIPEARTSLSLPHIEPVPEGYEPVNPPDNPEAIRLISKKYTPEEELEAVVKSVKGYVDSVADLPDEQKPTIAILVPRNNRGIEVIDALKKRGIETIELISSTSNTRAAAGSLNYLLSYLADPQSASKLSKAYRVWRRDWREGMSLRGGSSSEAYRDPTKQSPDEDMSLRGTKQSPDEDTSLRGTKQSPDEVMSLRGTKQSPDEDMSLRGTKQSPDEDMSLRGTKQSPDDKGIASGQRTSLAMTSDEEGVAMSRSALLATTSTLLRKMVNVENFVAPSQADDWLAGLGESEAEHVIQELSEFRVYVQRWLNAVTLPIDQLVLTLAQDVFSKASDLALAHKLALVLRQAANGHADWRLPELSSELALIARNERRFIGFSSDDSGFDPERHRGAVVVTTMHKAKGLEWDRVYLMSVNNYDFPSLQPYDRYISEKWFVRSDGLDTSEKSARSTRPPEYPNKRLNLEAEALAQLSALESKSEYEWYEEGAATAQSRLDYVKERLRLLYVGITRAKKDLIVTWNSGRQGDATPSLAMSELMGWWEK
ncbi:MAG: ATP-dependent helicase [Anaerolineales bacterium]|nr:ATP-dependent helicase [Anaerolineales bacterium]